MGPPHHTTNPTAFPFSIFIEIAHSFYLILSTTRTLRMLEGVRYYSYRNTLSSTE